MIETWDKNIRDFIKGSHKHEVRMIMVGGGAVKAGRPKELLDIQELQRTKNNLDSE